MVLYDLQSSLHTDHLTELWKKGREGPATKNKKVVYAARAIVVGFLLFFQLEKIYLTIFTPF